MRLYGGQVPIIAEEILRALLRASELEVTPENVPEVELDIQSVMREFIRLDREITSKARETQSQFGGSLGRAKRQLAKEKGVEIGEDAGGYIITQLIETFLHSNFVEEVYAEDHEIRKRIKPILRRYMETEEQLDVEVRDKIKNIEEGSAAWDIEYQRAMGNLKRNKNLE